MDPKRREQQLRYNHSAKGRANQRRYNRTEKGRERSRKVSDAKLRSYSSEKAREGRRRSASRITVEQRCAYVAVARALKDGTLTIPSACARCGEPFKRLPGKLGPKKRRNLEAHHHKGYAPEFWLDVEWLCRCCHKVADGVTLPPEPRSDAG